MLSQEYCLWPATMTLTRNVNSYLWDFLISTLFECSSFLSNFKLSTERERNVSQRAYSLSHGYHWESRLFGTKHCRLSKEASEERGEKPVLALSKLRLKAIVIGRREYLCSVDRRSWCWLRWSDVIAVVLSLNERWLFMKTSLITSFSKWTIIFHVSFRKIITI